MQTFARSCEESKKLAEEDKKTTLKEKQEQSMKRDFLTTFRDDNKMVRQG